MFGIVLKANWTEEPLTINLTRSSDDFPDGVAVDPDNAAATWPKALVSKTRDISVTSTASGRQRDAYVVRKP